MTYSPVGQHILIDLYGCQAESLMNKTIVQENLLLAAQAAGAHVLNTHFHSFGEQQGVTGVLLLQESHMSIHTWPENGYAALDVFMCGQARADAAVTCLLERFSPAHFKQNTMVRGAEPTFESK